MNASSRALGPLLSVLLAAPLALLACKEAADEPTGTSGAGPGEAGGSVHCTYAYRQSQELGEGQTGEEPAFQLEERALSVAADQDASETLGQLTFSVGYHTSEEDVDTVSLHVAAGGASVLSILYQLASGLPQNQFAGGHGFTGLLYFTHPTEGGDYQAFCEAVR